MTIPAGTQFGRYEIRSPIGAGGMGEVYLAHDTQLGRAAALKLLPSDVTTDPDRLLRFQQEARATSALNHPNILTIYEVGESGGSHFIATEFIDGVTLRDHMARGRMKTEEVLEVAIQVASALAAAHEAGIVHRDVKPENIMLRKDGYVKVLDFGLAKLTEERTRSGPNELTLADTAPGIVIGTVTYMSPEQARGLRVDARTDIFSLGVVLYEMLAGRAPFGGPTPSDVIVSILDREPQPLERLSAQVSPEMQRIVSKALAKDREERYQSVKEMLSDLRDHRRGLELATDRMRLTVSQGEAPAGQPDAHEMTVTRGDAQTVMIAPGAPGRRETDDSRAVETIRLDSNQPSTPEIAHVLFMDLVGFSKHRIHQQSYLQRKLTEIVSDTDEFKRAQREDQLICKSTGDGMALVFFVDPEAPVRCALQVSRALLENPDVELRMGIHSGPVLRTVDANRQRDVAGSGINIAQRVMDCGDAGHILLSKSMAEVLQEIGDRDEHLDDLGTTTVKHGLEVHLYNLYTDTLGNRSRPASLSVQPTVQYQTSSAGSRGAVDSLAVLPLHNASPDPGMEYLSDGITESIINTLSQLPSLKVMARATVFRYKGREVEAAEVRRDLGVRAVMSGRVLQLGDNLVIKTELVDAADGSQLWGEQYRRKSADIFEVQEEISREISEKLKIKLTGEEKKLLVKRYTDDTEAYRLYLKGRFCLSKTTRESLNNAIRHFQQAIEMDPEYALAFAGLADAYYTLSSAYLPPNEAMPKARAAATRALQLDDTLAEAHASLGLVKAFYEWDWAGAEGEYRRAIELNPGHASAHHWYGWYLALMGRLDEAIAEIKRASELDPLSLEINSDLGLSFFFARQYERAVVQFEKALEMDTGSVWTRFFLGWAHEQRGDFDRAVGEYERAAQVERSPILLAALGHAYVISGRRDQALLLLEEMKEMAAERHVSSYHFAIIHAALGEADEALAWLEKSYLAREEALVWLKVDPRLDTLRTHPRFIDLQRRVGLPL